MRVEQRIGRIDRIGQGYSEVWIRNYFYENTVEANVYKALEGRINWFETVVGDLQPILARVARTIQVAAMETGAAREELLAREIEAIKRDIDQKQLSGLDLDEYLAVEIEQRKEDSPPVTQSDIERCLVRFTRSKDLLQPHSTIVGAYQIWIEGLSVPVTFNPELFDEHPSTLRLISYGDDLFNQLLKEIETPQQNDLPPWIVRVTSEYPPLCSYYSVADSGLKPILTLSGLETALTQEPLSFNPDNLAEAQTNFANRVEDVKRKDHEIQEVRKRAEKTALLEKGRQLLLEATYIDIAMARYTSLFEQPPNLAGFTEDAVKALKRLGYPFAPLLRLVDTENLKPIPSDPAWARVQDASRESLRKKFEAIKNPIAYLLHKLKPPTSGKPL